MLTTVEFEKCIRDNLKERRFGTERGNKIVEDFRARTEYHKSVGEDPVRANELAMKDVFDTLSFEKIERTKRAAKNLNVAAESQRRTALGATKGGQIISNDGADGPAGGVVMSVKSFIEHDPRMPEKNYVNLTGSYLGVLTQTFGDVLDKISKGAFGVQKGKMHLENFVREFIDGTDTGDQTAKEMAIGWRKVEQLIPVLMNRAGGSMRTLDRYLPTRYNAARISRDSAEFVKDLMGLADWSRMRWPDGTLIAIKDRQSVAEFVANTLMSDGRSKIDPNAMRGRGRAMGNSLNSHRFIHLKNADAWLKMHNKYGDGNAFDAIVGHMTESAHRIALVDLFGPNPDAGFENLMSNAKRELAKIGGKEAQSAGGQLDSLVRPMYEIISRKNPQAPDNVLANTVTTLSHMLASAQLGSASLAAIPGDAATSAFARLVSGLRPFGSVDTYVKALATDVAGQAQIARQSGYIIEQTVQSVYAAQRFTGYATWAPPIAKRVSNAVMEASLLSGHTNSARWAGQWEMMGALSRSTDKSFADLEFRPLFERFGITPAEWDTFRAIPKYQHPKGFELLRPSDLLETKLPNRWDLYQKFHRMIYDASREMVLDATVEATAMLKGSTRPNTIPGAILHSFGMYKNFPVAFNLMYGRLSIATGKTRGGRIGLYAGLIAATTLMGALSVQMREIGKGREPMPVTDPRFAFKAMLAGGGLSIWGDFLFAGINSYGSGPQDMVAGPLSSFVGDVTQLAFGDIAEFIQTGDTDFGPTGVNAAKFAERYMPGSSLWYARLALERLVWDRLEELADPNVYSKRQRQVRQQEAEYGNGYWAPPNM